MKKIIVSALFLCSSIGLFSQEISFNGNSTGSVGCDIEFVKIIGVGFRVNTSEAGANSITPMVTATVIKQEFANYYIGIGLRGLDPVDIISVPIGVRVFPFKDFANFGFSLELDSQIGSKYVLAPSMGLYYKFGLK